VQRTMMYDVVCLFKNGGSNGTCYCYIVSCVTVFCVRETVANLPYSHT
jgi:hypothetical protein